MTAAAPVNAVRGSIGGFRTSAEPLQRRRRRRYWSHGRLGSRMKGYESLRVAQSNGHDTANPNIGRPPSLRLFPNTICFCLQGYLPMGGRREIPTRVVKDKSLSLRIYLSQQNVERPCEGSPTYSGSQRKADLIEREGAIVENVWVKIDVTIGKDQELLRAECLFCRDDNPKKTVLRAKKYNLPVELHKDFSLVQPTALFGLRALKNRIREIEEFRGISSSDIERENLARIKSYSTLTPTYLRALCNFEGYALSTPRGKFSINGSLGQYAQRADLKPSLAKYRPKAQGANFTFVSTNDSLNAQDPANPSTCAEADLNIQYTVRVCYSTPNIYFSTPDPPSYIPDPGVEDNSKPTDWLSWPLKQNDIPQAITTPRFGSGQSVCNIPGHFGARGVSALFLRAISAQVDHVSPMAARIPPISS
ncbi:hypothetical protein HOY82DRAFT_643921 [Tuber indicum]|nr:hypothetical protein HOY82DRAFT_643921 [Tuber indicum]